jgi:hypothetical protein
MQIVYILLISIFLSACAMQQDIKVGEKESVEYIADLQEIPQDVSLYSKEVVPRTFSADDFEKKYFRVWNIDKLSIDVKDAMWAYDTFGYGNSYGENLQLLDQKFFDDILENSNFDAYSTLNKKALSLNLLDIRAFPTDKPLLRDPKRAGEGFPFDYLQNSTIAPNKPLLVSHYSKDREWVFVESSFAFGWVKASEIVFIEKKYTDIWQKAEQIFLSKDGISIYSEDGKFLFQSRIGMMLPLIRENESSYTILSVAKDENSQPIYMHSTISKEASHKGVMAFNSENINLIISELGKSKYGWGGAYGERDCSSTLRDFYAPFGLWLPRNSSRQSQIGEVLSLEGLSDEEKKERINKYAIAFETLLYKQGHIVLYVGSYQDKIIVFQNVWGVKTKHEGVEGRFVVGKAVFSTLEIGSNLKEYDANASLLRGLKSLNTL